MVLKIIKKITEDVKVHTSFLFMLILITISFVISYHIYINKYTINLIIASVGLVTSVGFIAFFASIKIDARNAMNSTNSIDLKDANGLTNKRNYDTLTFNRK